MSNLLTLAVRTLNLLRSFVYQVYRTKNGYVIIVVNRYSTRLKIDIPDRLLFSLESKILRFNFFSIFIGARAVVIQLTFRIIVLEYAVLDSIFIVSFIL